MDIELLKIIGAIITGAVLVIVGRRLKKIPGDYRDLPKGDLIKQFNENWEARMK